MDHRTHGGGIDRSSRCASVRAIGAGSLNSLQTVIYEAFRTERCAWDVLSVAAGDPASVVRRDSHTGMEFTVNEWHNACIHQTTGGPIALNIR